MSFEINKNCRIAVNTGTGFYLLASGVEELFRKFTPETHTVRYMGTEFTQTEILGISQKVGFKIAYDPKNPAHEYIMKVKGLSGYKCETQIFIYNSSDRDPISGMYSGTVFPAAACVTGMSGDESGKTPFFVITGEFYLNGEGETTLRSVNG